MPDISKVSYKDKKYDIKDTYARNHLIDKTVNSDVSAIINFLNGISINGNSVLSGAEASAISVDASEEASVDVSVSANGIASFVFNIPRSKIAYISAYFSGDTVVFGNDDDYHAEFRDNEVLIGTIV